MKQYFFEYIIFLKEYIKKNTYLYCTGEENREVYLYKIPYTRYINRTKLEYNSDMYFTKGIILLE